MAIADLPWAMWLDSGGRARYDIIVAHPAVTLVTQDGQTQIEYQGKTSFSDLQPLQLIRQYLGEYSETPPDIRFAGGALGYWSYDFARLLHPLPNMAKDAEQLPEMAVGIYDWALQVDHQEKRAELISMFRFPQTESHFGQVLDRLQNPGGAQQAGCFSVVGQISSNFERHVYAQKFERIKHFLAEGDCYQVNLAQRFSAHAEGNALPAYLALRELSPAPYAAFMNFPFVQILCASPEQFLQLDAGSVTTRPIKGTRPVRADAEENAAMVSELQKSSKDRAENLMIVDLLRNDLGKHCKAGSVKVPELFKVESFRTVHHLVSTVTGSLSPDSDALTLLADCLPGGSITGAPKQRAMEIIELLEPDRRGVYCGAIGYIGFDGRMDTNIAIRTMVYGNGEIRLWAGGGIVADSDAASEFQETLDKAAAMLQVLYHFGARRKIDGDI